MMIGLTTRTASLHSDSFVNLIGENEFGWVHQILSFKEKKLDIFFHRVCRTKA